MRYKEPAAKIDITSAQKKPSSKIQKQLESEASSNDKI